MTRSGSSFSHSRGLVRRILERSCPVGELAEASLICALHSLLEQALRWQDGVDLGELNAAAAILQKLIASWQQVDGQRLAQMPRQEKNGGCGIGEEDLRHLEERLRLL